MATSGKPYQPTNLQACSSCGTAVAAENVLYTTDARIVCAKCYALADIVETDKRHAHAIRNAAIGAAIGGLLTFFSPMVQIGFVVLFAAGLTLATGIYAVQALAFAQERFLKHLTQGDRILIWCCSIFGIAIGGLVAVVWLLGVSLLFA
jgi:hypothetical protein